MVTSCSITALNLFKLLKLIMEIRRILQVQGIVDDKCSWGSNQFTNQY